MTFIEPDSSPNPTMAFPRNFLVFAEARVPSSHNVVEGLVDVGCGAVLEARKHSSSNGDAPLFGLKIER
jgi:hypothetical protein